MTRVRKEAVGASWTLGRWIKLIRAASTLYSLINQIKLVKRIEKRLQEKTLSRRKEAQLRSQAILEIVCPPLACRLSESTKITGHTPIHLKQQRSR